MLSDDNIFHYYFCIFNLIVPSMLLFRLVLAVFLNAQTSVSGNYICFLIINELLNIRNYRLDNINLNVIANLFIFFTFGLFILDVIPNLGSDIAPKCLDNTVFKIYSANEVNVNNSLQDSPLSSSSSSFGSFVFADRFTELPHRTFEQRLWLNRYDSLGDAKSLDLYKRLLLNKICLARNISAEIQLHIQDYI
jgi:hypothetical protein